MQQQVCTLLDRKENPNVSADFNALNDYRQLSKHDETNQYCNVIHILKPGYRYFGSNSA